MALLAFCVSLPAQEIPPNIETRQKQLEAKRLHANLGRIFNATGQFDRAKNEFQYAHIVEPKKEPLAPPGVYRITVGALAPVPIDMPEPEYSREARLAELEGAATLSVLVGDDGLARDIQVTEPIGLGLDEKAVEAVPKWRFQPGSYGGNAVPVLSTVEVDFRLPSKQSRWHLIRVAFDPPAGAALPVFLTAPYPGGPGLSVAAIDQGRLIGAIGRLATVSLSFDIDEHGVPVRFEAEKSSHPIWENEAIAVVRDWRFTPGMKNGVAVAVPCNIDLTWGPRNLSSAALQWPRRQLASPETRDEPPWDSVHTPGVARIHVAADVQAAKLRTKVEPLFPDAAKQAGVYGTVRLDAIITANGFVAGVHVVSGPPLLVTPALAAVEQWTYHPTLINGIPVEVTTEILVEFRPGR